MAQHTEVLLPTLRYTRTDFTALRAYFNRIPLGQIRAHYYSEDDLSELDCSTDSQLTARLEELQERLVLRASDSNPHLAELLKTARRSRTWSPKLIDFLVQGADRDLATPRPTDAVAAWFKTPIAQTLRAEAVRTLRELISLIDVRGAGWWKPLPRLGAGRAAKIEAWLDQYARSLGARQPAARPLSAGDLVVLAPDSAVLAPIERVVLPTGLDGQAGRNRATAFCQIAARHDYAAIDAYLTKFRHQEKTRRAYQKEIERFLLWCITVRGTALSSALHDDCEAFKDFLGAIPGAWIGPKCLRSDPRWRPFGGQLAPGSQRYAVQAVRTFFSWLVDVRYLGGNPWATVSDPRVAQAILPMQIDQALPAALWGKLAAPDGLLDQVCTTPEASLQARYQLRGASATRSIAAQFRLARAALLLIGDTGLRREEAAYATRDKLKPVPDSAALWELDVLGKRNRWRTVFPTPRAIQALNAHWRDRGRDFSYGLAEIPLLSPLSAPATANAQAKHHDAAGAMKDSGFSPDGLYQVVKTALKRIADDAAFDLSDAERVHLRRAAPHAFRHTFGTLAVAGEVPLDVVQKVLGHASLQTTTIYVQAEKKRSIHELGKFFKAE